MTIRGRRIFNCRPAVIFALALASGIILGEAVYGVHTVLTVCLAVLAFLFTVLLACFKKSRKFVYVALALLAGFVGITVSNSEYDRNLVPSYKGTFTATVASEIRIDGGLAKFYVSDIRADGVKFGYKAIVFFSAEDVDFNAGDVIQISGSINGNVHKKFDSLYASNRSKNIGYRASALTVKKLAEGDPTFPLNLQLAIKKTLYENNDAYTAGVCQALLLGDKSGIDGEDYSDIASSGLAHVLAVSGLHITALSAALYFILKKLKVNPKISLIIVTVLTFLYSLLCGFTASSLRAVIMTAVLMFSSAFGLKRDNLSSLALAAALILLFRPTALMEAGFLLSFGSVFGIFAFYSSFVRVGERAVNRISPKRGIGTRFCKVCSLSLATNIATLPLVAFFFGSVPTLFVLSNFFVLPYVMFLYAILILLTLLSLITTVGGFAGIMRFLVYPFRLYVKTVGSMPFSAIPISASVVGIICFLSIMIFMSKYTFATRRSKALVLTVGSAVSAVICMLFALI